MCVIEEVHTISAVEFWDILSPQNSLFDEPSKVIFRGQSNASWSLEPALFRDNNRPKGISNSDEIDSSMFMLHEIRMLQEFMFAADSTGIALPNDSMGFRDKHLNLNSGALDRYIKQPNLWPNKSLYELMAIAQHYGMPTRLLDWSKRSYIAAYFAASDALRNFDLTIKANTQKFVVWALNIERINLHSNFIDVIELPTGFNKNMSMQSGCFTVVRQSAKRQEPFDSTHLLDEFLINNRTGGPYLKKVTVPIDQAREVLQLCKLYGITATSLFPDLYGAAKFVDDEKNKWLWDESLRG